MQIFNDIIKMCLIYVVFGVGIINVMVVFTKYKSSIVYKLFFYDVMFGTVSFVVVCDDGFYRIGIDTNDDGKLEWIYDMGYFFDYGFNLYFIWDQNG